VLSNVHLIGGRDILDSEDFIVSNLLLPIGAMVYTLFCTMKFGWGFDKYIEEVNVGEGLKVPKGLRWYFTFGLPILIIVILVQGLIG
jgi:NSS family neurotransmitter:Na+ symporter